VILVRAKLGTLDIREIAKPLRYPKPIDLEDAEIGVWRIGQSDSFDRSPRRSRLRRLPERVLFNSPERQLARRYKYLLRNDTFHRSTYKAVEAALRNNGDDKPADIVYREMHRRAHRESGGWSPLFNGSEDRATALNPIGSACGSTASHPLLEKIGSPHDRGLGKTRVGQSSPTC
jgi:hypothetical protein